MEDSVGETSNSCGGDHPMRHGGNPPRQRSDGAGAWTICKVPAGAWTAFNIALSALFYLFDFATNLLTLRTYYFYSVLCPKLYYLDPSSAPHECHPINVEGHSFTTVFYVCLSLMAAAHLSNTLIFWVTLDPSEHPLRLAYFLPLIHLSRLLKVLWRTCSCNSLQDLQDLRQKESSSLYNVLAASLETAPQLMLQFHVVSVFGEQARFIPANLQLHIIPQPVPKTLIVSLLASLVSGTYNGSVAVLSLLQKRAGIMQPPLRWKACIAMLAGLHILTAMSTQTLITTALAVAVLPVMAYLFLAVIITWIFFAFVLQKSQHDSKTYRRSSHKWTRWMIHGVHSLALAHVSLFIGPMYVIVKLFDSPTFFLVRGTLLHIFVELLGFGGVVAAIYKRTPWGTACSPWGVENIYLNCDVFLESLCPLILILLVSTLVFANMVAKRDTNSCDSELQLPEQDEQQSAVLAAVSNELMETHITPAENSSVDPKVASPHHIHSSITAISCDEIPLLPSATPAPTSSKLQFVSISFVALFIKRAVLRHHKIQLPDPPFSL